MSNKTWFQIKAMAEDAEVLIFDEIGGWGIQAQAFAEAWPKSAKKVVVKINSPGGDVSEGYAVYNLILEARKNQIVNTRIEGMAASIASIVAMAGQTVEMSENSLFMMHNPWGATVGDSAEMRKTADLLDKVTGQLVGIYSSKTGKSDEDIRQLMTNETWLTAQEAVNMNFADKIVNTMSAKFSALIEPFKAKLAADGRLIAAMAKADETAPTVVEDPPKVDAAPVVDEKAVELAQAKADLVAARGEADQLKAQVSELTAEKAKAETLAANLAAMTLERDAMKAKFENAFSVPKHAAKGATANPSAVPNRL